MGAFFLAIAAHLPRWLSHEPHQEFSTQALIHPPPRVAWNVGDNQKASKVWILCGECLAVILFKRYQRNLTPIALLSIVSAYNISNVRIIIQIVWETFVRQFQKIARTRVTDTSSNNHLLHWCCDTFTINKEVCCQPIVWTRVSSRCRTSDVLNFVWLQVRV